MVDILCTPCILYDLQNPRQPTPVELASFNRFAGIFNLHRTFWHNFRFTHSLAKRNVFAVYFQREDDQQAKRHLFQEWN